jgi:flagellin-like hook-associated protein FlgL
MAVNFNNRILTLGLLRNISQQSQELEKIYERLSSGQRINRPSDDAAGLSIAQTLNANSRLYSQSIRNINDSISALQIADGALESLSGVVQRQKELATQAANGTLNLAQRKALQNESDALSQEYNRIIQSTQFNGISLLQTPNKTLNIQAGITASDYINVTLSDQLPVNVGSGAFTLQGNYQIATGTHIASGDFNEDGKIDIVASGTGGSQILLGNGDGTFSALVTLVGATTVSVQVADVNNDGNLDIISGNNLSPGSIGIFLGRGNGTFDPEISFLGPAGGQYYDLTINDFNSDGKLDVATAQNTGNGTTVFLGNGDGTYRIGSFNVVTGAALSVQSGDLNGDGKVDLLLLQSNGEVRTLIGNGDGTFAASNLIQDIGTLGVSTKLKDLNRDGILDFVTVDNTGDSINVFIGNGDGTFSMRMSFAGNAVEIEASDINYDGIQDLIFTDSNNNAVQLAIGNGDGTFKAMTSTAIGTNLRDSVVGDFNRDGILDIVTSSNVTNKIYFLSGNSVESVNMPYFNLLSTSDAQDAITTASTFIEHLALERGSIGASLSRLGTALRHAQNMFVETKTAQSRIEDVDVASTVAELVRIQILQQISTALLGQANQEPLLTLKLLENL